MFRAISWPTPTSDVQIPPEVIRIAQFFVKYPASIFQWLDPKMIRQQDIRGKGDSEAWLENKNSIGFNTGFV